MALMRAIQQNDDDEMRMWGRRSTPAPGLGPKRRSDQAAHKKGLPAIAVNRD